MKILAMTCCCVDVFPEKNTVVAGGNALNLAVACSKTGKAGVYVMGNIGDDDYGKTVRESASRFNIDLSRLYTVKGFTAHHVINIDSNGDRYFKPGSWHDGVWKKYIITPSDAEFMKEMDAVATTCYESCFESIIDLRKKSNFMLSVDFHDEKINSHWEKYFNMIDLFFISGNNQNLDVLEKWSKKFNTVFTATLGRDGSISFHKGKKFLCDAVKVEKIIDTTGCGDSYQGTFLTDYLLRRDVRGAMESGSKAAAETLSFVGGF